jgi:hypothetical protein
LSCQTKLQKSIAQALESFSMAESRSVFDSEVDE